MESIRGEAKASSIVVKTQLSTYSPLRTVSSPFMYSKINSLIYGTILLLYQLSLFPSAFYHVGNKYLPNRGMGYLFARM